MSDPTPPPTAPFTGAAPLAVAAARPPRRPRRRGRWIAVGAVLGILIIAATSAVSTHIVISREYDAAAAVLLNRVESARHAQHELADARSASERDIASATTVLDAATPAIVPGDARDALQAEVETAIADVERAAAVEAAGIPEPPAPIDDKPLWTWELASDRDDYRADAEDAEAAVADLADAREQLDRTRTTLGDSAAELFAAADAASEELLADNVSAKTGAVIAFRRAAEGLAEATALSGLAVDRFTTYAESADELRASQKAEMKEKAGPLLKKRLAVEKFARSLSGGVLLDFDWKRIVLGYGWSDSMAGTATWNTAHGGSSTITLSNSVAEQWPSTRAKALVAHEVGHAITAKCYQMIDWESSDENEEWATAWAIGQGFTSDANGVQAYGQPRQSMIEKARSCR